MKVFHKLFNTKAQSLDDNTKSVTFVISTNDEDRYGDVVDQKSWNFKDYLSNPIVLWGHDPGEPENVLGTAKDLQISGDGHETTATLTFDTEINPKASLVYNQIKRGTLRTVSVGFRNHTLEYDEDTPILKDNELLEISVVPIPANAGALAKDLKAGHLNVKDARWLMDGMRKEADLLEQETKAQTEGKEIKKSMTEEQATQIIDGFAALKNTVETQAATIEELKTRLPEPESDEQKAEREAKEAADQKAADEAAAAKAKEEAEANSAKGGDHDQPGADEDDLDLDAELTPEQEAEAREALGLPAAA